MAASDEFKQQLKAGKIVDALALALGAAMELKITTWVASESGTDTETSGTTEEVAKPGNRLRTRINLLEGDLENEIGNKYLGTGPYAEVREFHQEQVAESYKIIQNNLNSLQKLVEFWVRIQHLHPDALPVEFDVSDVESQLLPPANQATTPPSLPSQKPFPGSSSQTEPREPVIAPKQAAGIPSLDELQLGTSEQWNSSALQQMKILPGAGLPSLDELQLGTPGNWENLLTQQLQQPASTLPSTQGAGENQQVLPDTSVPESPPPELNNSQALEPATLAPQPADLVEQQTQIKKSAPVIRQNSVEQPTQPQPIPTLPNLVEQPLSPQVAPPPLPNLDDLYLGTEENWGKSVEQSTQPQTQSGEVDLSTQNDDWENWALSAPTPVSTPVTPSGTALKAEDEEDWDNWILETPSATPNVTASSSDDEEWDNWVDAELEHQDTLQLGTAAEWKDFASETLAPFSNVPNAGNNFDEALSFGSTNTDLTAELEAQLLAERKRLEQLENLRQMPEPNQSGNLSDSGKTTSIQSVPQPSPIMPEPSTTNASGIMPEPSTTNASGIMPEPNVVANPKPIEQIQLPPPPPPPPRINNPDNKQ